MLEIRVFKPVKIQSEYRFCCQVKGLRISVQNLKKRIKNLLRYNYNNIFISYIHFGYKATNFKIKHSELWDSIYPLMFLTRNGGPLFKSGDNTAIIEFEYPILARVRDFYIKQASNFGLKILVRGPEFEKSFNCVTSGHAVAFGGGKDSRLLYGILSELNYSPKAYTAGIGNAEDIQGARIAIPVCGCLTDRIMPALMSRSRVFYFGSGLGEVQLEKPWQQCYDFASPAGLKAFSKLLFTYGVETGMTPPACILPYNIIQRILYERYPELYKFQNSVRNQQESEKNLHVSLLKLYHGLDIRSHCNEKLFKKLLKAFVHYQTNYPFRFGYRNYREVVNKEMRAIIYHLKDESLFSEARDRIPHDWQGEWINYIHKYVFPDISMDFMNIYEEYSLDIDSAPGIKNDFRVPI